MLFAYLDESYTADEDYWLGACLIDAQQAMLLRHGMSAAAATVPAGLGIASDVELHAQHLFGGRKEFEPLKGLPEARVRTYLAGVEAVVAADPEVLLVGVSWSASSFHGAIRIHRMETVQHMLTALDAFLLAADDHCLVIADEEEGTTRDVYRELQAHQGRAAASGAPSRIRDVVFVDSRFSPGVQGADLITYLHRRRARTNHPKAQKALDAMWALLDGRVAVSSHAAPSPP